VTRRPLQTRNTINRAKRSERGGSVKNWRERDPQGRYSLFSLYAVFSYKNQNSKKKFRHMHRDLNLDEIKNALRLLPVNREMNLMNLIKL